MSALTSTIALIGHIIEGQDTVDINDGELGAVAVKMKLLRTATESKSAFKLDVGNRVLKDLARCTTDKESIGRGSNCSDLILTCKAWGSPSIFVVDTIGLGLLVNVESVLLA